jgi:hypothetical protein
MRRWYKLECYGGEDSETGAEEICEHDRAEQTRQKAGVEEGQPQAGAEEIEEQTLWEAGAEESQP